MPNVKTDRKTGPGLFGRLVYIGINRVFAVGPELFPREQFRIVEQQTPELDETTVGRAFVGMGSADVLVQFLKGLFGSLEIDPTFTSCFLVKFAKASDARGICAATMPRADRVVQRSLPLRAPHDSVNVVRFAVVLR